MRRFRHPLASFFAGSAGLGAIFCFALWLESGLVSGGQGDYQMGLPYRYFIRAAFVVFLMFVFIRSVYLWRYVIFRKADNAA